MSSALRFAPVFAWKTAWVAASVALATSGCAFAQPSVQPRALPDELRLGRLGERTAFESGETQPPTAGPSAPAASDTEFAGDNRDSDLGPDDDDKNSDKNERRRKGVFIAGVILASIGTVGTVAFAAAGEATQNKLSNGYDGALSRSEESKLNDRGSTFNNVAIGSAAVGVIGLGMAMIALGIDYTHCGKIVKARRAACK